MAIPKESNTLFLQATRSKVIAAFMLAFSGIVLALGITYFSFHELLSTVDELSEPNRKLRVLNELFREITSLDQFQRAELLKNPGVSSNALIGKSHMLLLKIDSLKAMPWQNDEQVQRIHTMEEILIERNQYFIAYLQLKYEDARNKSLLKQLDSLSEALSHHVVVPDTAIISRSNRTVTTRYLPDSTEKTEQRSFFSRLFKRKKFQAPAPAEQKVRITEELHTAVDTIPIVKNDSMFYQVGQVMKILNTDERLKNRKMLQRELKLVTVNTQLLNQLLSIVHEVEAEEVNQLRKNNEAATQFVNLSIKRIVIFLVIFFLMAALLLFLILIDISKSNYYRKQLTEAKDEAERLSQVKQRFLANITHEIRTPLQSIIGYAEQLDGSPSDIEAIHAIRGSSGHLLHIVNEVLDYSRIESGTFKFTIQPFKVSDVIADVLSSIKIQAQQKELALLEEVTLNCNTVVLGDAFRIRQILYNLLSNAVKFTHAGYVKLSAECEEHSERMHVAIKVSDTGIGMNPDDIDRVLHQFEQANPAISATYGGTGLGLTIVKTLIDAQGGALQVTSEPGAGSVFTVRLEFEKSKLPVMQEEPGTTKIHTADATGNVIVVDDDTLILRLCKLILNKHGITCYTVQQPAEILKTKIDPSVTHIFLDIRMPHINGVDLCHELRHRLGDRVFITALTAHALPGDREELMNKGFDAVLLKPFRETELLKIFGKKFHEAPDRQADHDLSLLTRMTSGDRSLLASIIEQFDDETNQDLDALELAAGINDIHLAEELVHKLAGRIGQMGGNRLSRELRALETELQQNSARADAKKRIKDIMHDVRQFQAAVEETQHE